MTGIFGGMEPEGVAEAIGGGFATWVDTDAADDKIVAAQGAMVVHAPQETTWSTVSDFENAHRFMGVSQRNKVKRRGADEVEVKLKQGIGLGPFSVGLSERFRFRLRRPDGIDCVRYLGGPFDDASLSFALFPLPEDRTLLVMTFICDLLELGGLIKKFFDKQPEIAFAAGANVVVIPLLAYVQEAERRANGGEVQPRPPTPAAPDLVEAGALDLALRRGYLTLGALTPESVLDGVSSVTRLGAPRQEVWPTVEDPQTLASSISFVSRGGVARQTNGELLQSVEYTVRFGILRKRYEFTRRARAEPPERVFTVEANADGVPIDQTETLWEHGGLTTLCQRVKIDLKQDWFANLFLKQHPEFECLIGTYSPAVFVRAVRKVHGPPS